MSVAFDGKTHFEAYSALQAYAERKGLKLIDALCHALQALGAADAYAQQHQLYYLPGADVQERVTAWHGYARVPINLKDVAQKLKGPVVPIPFKLVTQKAADSYVAFMQANKVNDAAAVATGIYLLIIAESKSLTFFEGDNVRFIEFGTH